MSNRTHTDRHRQTDTDTDRHRHTDTDTDTDTHTHPIAMTEDNTIRHYRKMFSYFTVIFDILLNTYTRPRIT